MTPIKDLLVAVAEAQKPKLKGCFDNFVVGQIRWQWCVKTWDGHGKAFDKNEMILVNLDATDYALYGDYRGELPARMFVAWSMKLAMGVVLHERYVILCDSMTDVSGPLSS